MSQRSWLLVVLATALLAFGVGLQLGRTIGESPSRSYTPASDVPLDGVALEARTILLNKDVLERTRALAELLGRLGPEALEDLKRAYSTVFFDLGDTDLVLLGEWWARFDPEGAFEWTGERWQADHPEVIKTVMRVWGKQDPKTALERAQITKPELRGLYTAAVLAGWEESDQPAVLEYVEAMPPGHDRQRAIQVVARRKVLRDGPAAAFEWAEGLDEGDELFKLNVIRRVASSAAEVQPQHAARWAEKLLGGDFESGIPQRVGTRWAKRDPIAAMDWLSTLAPGRGRDDGVRETFRKWLRWDDEAAMDWANGVKLEPWLDPVISIVAKRLSKEDPLLALDWASRVHDEPLRLATTGVVARVWVIRDEPKASEWIAQADLPAYLKRKIFEIPETMQPGFMKRVREKGLAEARREFAAERRAAGAQPK